MLTAGPWHIEGAVPTMPGFDPGRALARPQGTFVLLPGTTASASPGSRAPRTACRTAGPTATSSTSVEADIDLGFFFPGAEGASKPTAVPDSAA